MSPILLGNIITLVGAIIMVSIGLIKTRRNILLAQCVQLTVMGIGNLILGGASGFVSNLVSIARNIYGIKYQFTTTAKIIFIALQVGVTAAVRPVGFIAWLPCIAAVLFTCFMNLTEMKLKLLIIVNQCMWLIFDYSISNFVGFTFDILTILSNLMGIYALYQAKTGKKIWKK